MTRHEIKKKNAKQRRKMIISLSLIAIGLIMVITAAIMEASHYPWGLLFGTSTQNADAIADPSPIKLDVEDQNVIITAEASIDALASDTTATDEPAAVDTSPSNGADLPGNVADTEKAPAVSKFVVIGTLKIPVLKVSQNLLEGAGKQMKYGVGHIPSTAAVGQPGNCAIAGHRPYPFRYLDQLKSGDNIVIKTGGHAYTYTVFDSFAVLPNEVWVLNSMPGENYTLTLITCTPYMVSSHRLIIRARLTDVDGKTPQDFYGIVTPEVTPSATVDPSSTDTPAITSPFVSETDSSPAISTATTSEVPSAEPPSTDTIITDNVTVSP